MAKENESATLVAPVEGAEAEVTPVTIDAPAEPSTNSERVGDTQEQNAPLTNTQKVLEWMGLYYSLCTGVNPPWLTVSAGGFRQVSFNLGNWLLAGFSAVVGYLTGRAAIAVGRVAVKTYTGV